MSEQAAGWKYIEATKAKHRIIDTLLIKTVFFFYRLFVFTYYMHNTMFASLTSFCLCEWFPPLCGMVWVFVCAQISIISCNILKARDSCINVVCKIWVIELKRDDENQTKEWGLLRTEALLANWCCEREINQNIRTIENVSFITTLHNVISSVRQAASKIFFIASQ